MADRRPTRLGVVVGRLGRAGRGVALVVASGVLLLGLWVSGAAIPADRPRRYARRVHAAGRVALAAAVVGLVAWPLGTVVALALVGGAAGGVGWGVRVRANRPGPAALPARRVKAVVGPADQAGGR